MASLTLKNLPEGRLRNPRKAAEKEHRSLTQQVIHLRDAALQERRSSIRLRRATMEAQISAWRKLAGRWESDIDEGTEAARLQGRRTPGRKVEM